MFGKVSRVLVVVVALLMLVGTVSAQVNNPVNSFLGGDSLFCNSARGCWLLNAHGVLLGEFAQADIQTALATCAADATNVIIGTIDGTYGPFTLSAVYDGPNADPTCSLQFNGSEGEGKEAKPYVFTPRSDGSYQPIGVPVGDAAPVQGGICNGAGVGDTVVVDIPGVGATNFTITSIYLNSGILVFDNTGTKFRGIPCSLISGIV